MFDKFGKQEYITLLKLIKKNGISIKSYGQKLLNEKAIILRHDVDFCPNMALRIALIEKKLNIKSTYFFLVSSNFYNIFSKQTLGALRKIMSLGHEIGLHFDASIYKKKEINSFCNYEAELLKIACNKPINIVSFHRPVKSLLNSNSKIGKFKHTYMKQFFKDMYYCSDSEGIWRYKKPSDIIKENKNKKKFHMQLLIHPIWWATPNRLSPSEKIEYFMKIEKKNMINNLEINSKPFRYRKINNES